MGNNWEEKKMEWQKMMDAANKMEEMMKGMDTTGMEEMNAEWMKMRESMKKLDEMMMEKHEMKEGEGGD